MRSAFVLWWDLQSDHTDATRSLGDKWIIDKFTCGVWHTWPHYPVGWGSNVALWPLPGTDPDGIQNGTFSSKNMNSDLLGVTCATSRLWTSSLCVFLGTMVNPGGSSQPPAVGTGSLSWKRCAGCGGKIADRFLLYTMDSYWHSRCLKCSCCQAQLGEIGTSCYTKSGMILCRNDYIRWEKKDFVMRAYSTLLIVITTDYMK